MTRSAGVTVNAVVALLGSVLTMALGALMLFGMVFALRSAPVEPPKDFPLPAVYLKALMMLMPLFYVLPAIWGICTGIGLLRLKNWARISIIVFGGLLAFFGVFGAFGALIVSLVRLPNTPERWTRPPSQWFAFSWCFLHWSNWGSAPGGCISLIEAR
jgi:hypothetical protein